MFRLSFWFTALVLVTFCVVNRGHIDVSLWPFPYQIGAPMSIFLFIAFTIGFFLGFLCKSLKNLFSKPKGSAKTIQEKCADAP